MTGLLLLIFSYALLLVFVAAFVYRSMKLALLPHHLRWELSPIPHEKGKGHYGGSYLEDFEWWKKTREKSLVSEVIYMLKEIIFLKGVWENNKKLWYFSFPFHIAMYLLVVMIACLVLGAVMLITGITLGAGLLDIIIKSLAGSGYIVGLLGAMGLIASRLMNPDLKKFNAGGAVFNLFFLLAVFLSGTLALISLPDFSGAMIRYTRALLFADSSLQLPGLLVLHCVLGLLFLAYLPFTRMMHFVAKYFTYHEVRWNDKPMLGNDHLQNEIGKLLQQPVTWSAPHLKADGKKNWVDIATEEKM